MRVVLSTFYYILLCVLDLIYSLRIMLLVKTNFRQFSYFCFPCLENKPFENWKKTKELERSSSLWSNNSISIQSAEPIGMARWRRNMSLGLTQSERYSKRMRSSPGAEWKATLPLTLENRVGRANDQSACRWTHHMTPRRAKVWRVRRGSTLYNYSRKNMAPLTDRPVVAANLIRS